MNYFLITEFYSFFEKIGFKKHTLKKEELTYLNTLTDIKKCDLFHGETDFIIKRLYLKIFLAFFTILAFLVSFLVFQNYFLIISFVFIVLLLALIIRYFNKIGIYKIEKAVYSAAKKNHMELSFK